ncbi:MAG: carbohydrate kinase family protein [Chloroflexota bacterium]|nr:carbohydrate kinase family protein [Chloroflexota bacterium]
MSILVTGSLAYDHIMDFHGYYKDHILPEKVHILNVSFLVQGLRKQRGGTATNIAYSLNLLQEKTAIMGTVGHDFADYRAWLEEQGIDTHAIKVIPDEFTASCFIMTDLSGNQITGFYPGAMSHAHQLKLSDFQLSDVKLAIVAPNDPLAMVEHIRECRKTGVPYIFDPGQQALNLSAEQLMEGFNGAKTVIGNDYELGMIENKTGYSPEKLLEVAEMVVITKGEQGSTIITQQGTVEIPTAPAQQVVDPTGAGDAYRAGIIKGLLYGYSPETMGRIAALSATYCVENYGTQNHKYTASEFCTRYAEAFGENIEALFPALEGQATNLVIN